MLAKQTENVTLMVGNAEVEQRILLRATFQQATVLTGRLPNFLC